jgi:hypothetical protein
MDIYTMEQWEKDKTLNVKVGQFISNEVFWELCGALPPATWERGIFQPGEAYSHDWNRNCALYQTFKKNGTGDAEYQYVGLKPLGEC